jgi:endo-1,4-beta-mannosidase
MSDAFLLGMNDFYADPLRGVSRERVGDRLGHIAGLKARAVRLLLPWKDLQPEGHRVPDGTLRWMEMFLEESKPFGLRVMPVFFCGRLTGANWLPDWMCETMRPLPTPLDFYRERGLIRAQQLQIEVVVGAFAKHEAVLGWDLGRETSSLAPAPDPDAARSRLLWLLEALKKYDEAHSVTLTLSQSDLEQDRGVRPSDLAEELDFLSVHVAPGDTSRAVHGSDAVGFYCGLARALSGKPVLISELGFPSGDEEGETVTELLESARQSGSLGAFAWSLEDTEGTSDVVTESFRRFAASDSRRLDASFQLQVDEAVYYSKPEESIRAAYEEYQKNRREDLLPGQARRPEAER